MRKSKLSKIKILHLYSASSLLIITISVFLLLGSFRTSGIVSNMQETTSRYIMGQDAVNDMMRASDLLTEKARLFVVMGQTDDALDYFNEINNQKNREQSLKKIAGSTDDHKAEDYLAQAMKESEKLADIEKYAMKLAVQGYGIKSEKLNKELKKVKISSKDAALSSEEKKQKSIDMMLNEDYKKQKSRISEGVSVSLQNLVDETRVHQLKSYESAKKFSDIEHVLIVIAIIVVLVMLVITAYSIIIPINRSTVYIKNNELLPLRGAAEYVYLAETYNKMLLETKKHNEELSHDATHDELTGLYNRKIFDAMREEIDDDDIAMLIVDLDNFKAINDNYGHGTGDNVLKKVADALSSSFRFEDLVCRVGGDEFVVIMMNANTELVNVIDEKIRILRKKLEVKDGLPEITVSIGVAFNTNKEKFDRLYKNADAALYETKKKGKNGYSIYGFKMGGRKGSGKLDKPVHKQKVD